MAEEKMVNHHYHLGTCEETEPGTVFNYIRRFKIRKIYE